MKIIVKIVLWLLSLAALALALWIAEAMVEGRAYIGSAMLIVSGIFGAACLIFSVIINPFIAHRLLRNPATRLFVSALTLIFALLAGTEGPNYLAWSDFHRQANEMSRASFANIEVDNHNLPDAHYVGHTLDIQADLVINGAAGREFIGNESGGLADIAPKNLNGTASPAQASPRRTPHLTFKVIGDGELSSRVDLEIPAFALFRSKLAALSEQDDSKMASAYLDGGQIVVRGEEFHAQFPICDKAVEYIGSAPSTKSPYLPASFHTQLANADCADITAKYVIDAMGRPALQPSDLLVQLGREKSIFVDILARDGTLVLTARFPISRLREAETAANVTAGKMARGELESHFSPFTNYTNLVATF